MKAGAVRYPLDALADGVPEGGMGLLEITIKGDFADISKHDHQVGSDAVSKKL